MLVVVEVVSAVVVDVVMQSGLVVLGDGVQVAVVANAGPASNAPTAADNIKLCLLTFDLLPLKRRSPLCWGENPFVIRHTPFLEPA